MQRYIKAKRVKAFEKYSNIKELLNNWKYIRAHCVNALSKYSQIDDEDLQHLMSNPYADPDANVMSIVRSKQYTEILIHHIDKNIRDWENTCGKTQDGRLRRRIIRGNYFSDPWKSLHQIADEEHKTYDFIKEQRDKAIKELSALIFGADGLLKVDGAMYIHTFEETRT